MKKKTVIADDKTVYREALENFLANNDLEIVGVAADGFEVIEKVERFKPDLLLLDIALPNLIGRGIFRWMRKNHPRMKIIVLTMHQELLKKAMESKDSMTDGYCLKDCDPDLLLSGIKRVLEGETFVCHCQ
jgi:two-component system nitrate/nitrite response regulator NarL